MNPTEYLSDEELFALIECSEAEGLVSAPQDLKSAVLTRGRPPAGRRQSWRTGFAAYCVRVGVAAAAAIALVFAAPQWEPVADRIPEQKAAFGTELLDRVSNAGDRLQEGYRSAMDRLIQFNLNINSNFGGNEHE